MFNRKIGTISWKIHRPYEGMFGGGTPTYTKEVTGNGYIDLTDAVVNKLLELKAYGGCEQASTPTPSTPVDIVCNNGTLKVKDKELPVGYVRIESIEFDGSTYYDTNEKLYGSDTISMKISGNQSSGMNCFGAYTGTGTGNYNYSLYVYFHNSSQCYLRYGDTLYRPVLGTGTRTIKFGPGATTGFSTNVTITADTFESIDAAYIGALPNSSSAKFNGTFYGNIEVSDTNGTRLKWIPCKRKSDGVIGYYEVVNGNFLEPVGDTPTAGAEDYSNIEVYVQGTKEKVGYSGGATATCEDLLGVGTYLDEQEILSGNVIVKCGVFVLDGTETFGSSSAYGQSLYIQSWSQTNGAVKGGLLLCSHFLGTTQPGGTGAIDTCFTNTTGHLYFRTTETAADFKQFLKDQLTAGTPVIIVYPLAEETTLSVAGQSLSIPAGNSRIEIVEGSILNLPLYAKYKSTSE